MKKIWKLFKQQLIRASDSTLIYLIKDNKVFWFILNNQNTISIILYIINNIPTYLLKNNSF